MDNTQHEKFVKATNTSLPFYNVVNMIVQYLGTLPFMEEFNGAIYNYEKADFSNLTLPAVNVNIESSRSRGAGFINSATIFIDIIRNINVQNRASIYNFKDSTAERIVQSLFFNQDFRALLWSYCPYLGTFGNNYSTNYLSSENTVRITGDASYYFGMYMEWVEQNGFDPTGVKRDVNQARTFSLSQYFSEEY